MRGWRITGRALSSRPMMMLWFAASALTAIIGVATGDTNVIFGLIAAAFLGAARQNRR